MHLRTFHGLLENLASNVSALKASLSAFLSLLKIGLEESPGDLQLNMNLRIVSDYLPAVEDLPELCHGWLTHVNHALSLAPKTSVKPEYADLNDTASHRNGPCTSCPFCSTLTVADVHFSYRTKRWLWHPYHKCHIECNYDALSRYNNTSTTYTTVPKTIAASESNKP